MKGADGGRAGDPDDLGGDGQPRVGATNCVEGCRAAGERAKAEGRGVGRQLESRKLLGALAQGGDPKLGEPTDSSLQ